MTIEERASLERLHNSMRDVIRQLAAVQSSEVEFQPSADMSTMEILREMNNAMDRALQEIGPALNHPMIKHMIRLFGRT